VAHERGPRSSGVFLVFAFIFLVLAFVWLFSEEVIGSYRAIRRA
jgi:hypothetical protein